jgi:siroheme synthase
MGLASRGVIATALLAQGWPSSTPAAILWGAATPEPFRWTGALADLGDADTPPGAYGAPGTIVIGAVVDLANVLGVEPSNQPLHERPPAAAAGAQGGRYARRK